MTCEVLFSILYKHFSLKIVFKSKSFGGTNATFCFCNADQVTTYIAWL